MKYIFFLLLLVGASMLLGSDFPKGSPKFKSSAATAMSAGKKENKPVILIFSASWCPPCQAMKKDVYPSAEVQALHDKFIWAYLDVDDSGTRRAAEKAGVNGIPHIQFLDSKGNEVGKQVGGTSAASFAGKLKEVLASTASAEKP